MNAPVLVTATCYLQVKPLIKRNRWDATQMAYVDTVDSISVVAQTKKRPGKPQSGAVVVKLTLRFNEMAFLPLTPQAVIDIPDSFVLVNQVIEVEAEDPNDQAAIEALVRAGKAVTP